MDSIAKAWQRRRPEATVLYRVLAEHLETFLARTDEHADVRVDGCNHDRLERLCQYALRPPIVHERLSLTSNGKVLLKFKKPWRDGSTHSVLAPLTLIERLAALIPSPRRKLVTYHGVFAPAFPLRDTVVPPPPVEEGTPEPSGEQPDAQRACSHQTSAPAPATPPALPTRPNPKPSTRSKPRPRYLWADLLRRDALTCPHCGATRRLLAFVTDPIAIHRILDHLARTGRGPPDEDDPPRDLAITPGS